LHWLKNACLAPWLVSLVGLMSHTTPPARGPGLRHVTWNTHGLCRPWQCR